MTDDVSEKGMKWLTEGKDHAERTKIDTKEALAAYGAYEFGAAHYPELTFCKEIAEADKKHSMSIKGMRAEQVVEVLTHRAEENAKRMGQQEMLLKMQGEVRPKTYDK